MPEDRQRLAVCSTRSSMVEKCDLNAAVHQWLKVAGSTIGGVSAAQNLCVCQKRRCQTRTHALHTRAGSPGQGPPVCAARSGPKSVRSSRTLLSATVHSGVANEARPSSDRDTGPIPCRSRFPGCLIVCGTHVRIRNPRGCWLG
eukprot:7329902-Prymnesium_polylepis.1